MNNCIVLAGGLGTRLRPLLNDCPKCLAPVRDKPFLYWLVQKLRSQGLLNITLSLGYGHQKVTDMILSDSFYDQIDWVIENTPLGTGGAISHVMKNKGYKEAVIINGDTFLTGNFMPMLQTLDIAGGELMRIGLVSVSERSRYGAIVSDSLGTAVAMHEKTLNGPGLINSGLYRVSNSIFSEIEEKCFSLESHLLPKLISLGNVQTANIGGAFIDIGVPADYIRAEQVLY